MSSKSGETRRNCGHAAKPYAGLCNARPRVHLIGRGWSRQGNSFGSSLLFRYSPYSQRGCNVGRRTPLSILLVSQGFASCNCRKFHIDKFFCDRHTIVAAASQFAVTHEFVERAADAARGRRTGVQAQFLIASRCPSFNQAAHLVNMLTVQPVLLDRKRGVYRDNIATSFGCASHRDRLGNLCP